jgi:hypothetical protein
MLVPVKDYPDVVTQHQRLQIVGIFQVFSNIIKGLFGGVLLRGQVGPINTEHGQQGAPCGSPDPRWMGFERK